MEKTTDLQQPILIVDDDAGLTHTLQRALSRRNYHVFVAHQGSAAVDIIKANPQLEKVVLDLKLENESGLRLIPEFVALNPRLKIVVLTGYSSIATAVEAIKLGASNYLCKPLDADEILAGFEVKASVELNSDELVAPSLDRLEWEHIQKTLRENNDNISATARALNMHRRTLQRKLNKYPVKR